MAYKRNVEIFEEAYTKKDNKSTLSYLARDGRQRYIPGSSDPNVEPGGGSSSVPVVVVEGDTPEQELAPNTFYKFGTVDSLTLTLGEGEEGVLNIFAFSFTAGTYTAVQMTFNVDEIDNCYIKDKTNNTYLWKGKNVT